MENKSIWNVFNQVVTKTLPRILLYGVPGTGKTTSAIKSADKGYYNITLNEDSSVAELIGMWIPKGREFKWTDGVGIKAWKEGKLLVINEIDKTNGAVLTMCHALLDDPYIARLSLPSGEEIKPHEDFRCVATMNGSLDDLPLPLMDRFDVKLQINEPHPEAINTLAPWLQKMATAAYSNHSTLNITFRQIKAFEKLCGILDRETAADIIFKDMASDVINILRINN